MDQQPDESLMPSLDPSLYDAAAGTESLEFFKFTTGIQNDGELKEHILDVQAQAYALVPYPCIRSFNFMRLKISRMPAYKDVLKLGQERRGALLLDIGCCFGNDTRKAALDGFPAEQIVASDLRRELWDLGHVLFRSTPKSFPATFVAGDALDPTFLSPFKDSEKPPDVSMSSIKTLNDLRGKVSAIWASSFFHLFSEKRQHQLAHALGSLLSPESGSIIFGSHLGLPNKGVLTNKISDKTVKVFCHDPDSWKEMWVGQLNAPCTNEGNVADNVGGFNAAVFPPDGVKLDSRLIPVRSEGEETRIWTLVWSITRL